MLVGELSLDGTLRPVRGALSIAVCARRQGIPNLLVPADNAAEAAVTEGVRVFGMRHLAEVVSVSQSARSIPAHAVVAAVVHCHRMSRCPIFATCAAKPPPSARSKWRPPAATTC